MKIIINTSLQRFGGGVQVALSFINECVHFPQNEYHVWVGPGLKKIIDPANFPPNFHFYHFNFGEVSIYKIRNIQKTLRQFEIKIKPQILISTTGPSYYHSIAPQILGFNLPLYIYPESPYLKGLAKMKCLKLWLKKQVHFYFFKRDAIAYVVQTEDVAERVKNSLGNQNVFVVTNNHSNFYNENPSSNVNKLPTQLENEFRFLTLSAYYAHKNLEIIPKIIEILSDKGIENIKFILTLQEEQFKNTIRKHRNIINVGPLSPQECPSLYQECDAMLLPTLAECFSASYPEAMKMKKPIITTDLGFARSICGASALYFKPMDADDAVEKIIALIHSRSLRKSLVDNGLLELKKFDSPSERASKYLKICSDFI